MDGVAMFESIEDKERYYFARLQQRYLLALPTIGALGAIGETVYGLDNEDYRGIRFYKEHRKRFVSTIVEIWRKSLSIKERGGLPKETAEWLTKVIDKIWREEGAYSRSLAERVLNKNVDFNSLQIELEALDDRKRSILNNSSIFERQPSPP